MSEQQVKTNDGWVNIHEIQCTHCQSTFMDNKNSEWMSRNLDDDGWFCDSEVCHFDELRNHVDEVISLEDEFRDEGDETDDD